MASSASSIRSSSRTPGSDPGGRGLRGTSGGSSTAGGWSRTGWRLTTDRLCLTKNAGEFTLNDHICSWSRVDYLRRQDEGRRFARFMRLLKAPHATTGNRVTFATRALGAGEGFRDVLRDEVERVRQRVARVRTQDISA